MNLKQEMHVSRNRDTVSSGNFKRKRINQKMKMSPTFRNGNKKQKLLNNTNKELLNLKKSTSTSVQIECYERPPLYVTVMAFVQYAILVIFGYFRDFLRSIGLAKGINCPQELSKMKDFVPLYSDFAAFYMRNFYALVRDSCNRPICSVPGSDMQLMERIPSKSIWSSNFTGRNLNAINLGSYNYLGFAQNSGPCTEQAVKSVNQFGLGTCSSRREFGSNLLHRKLEKLVAEFLGVEDSICFAMGFATNSMNIPCFVNKGCLILSDELNHASVVLGCRLSGATIQVFKHNDMTDLEEKLKNAIIMGQSRTRRPYKKILICIEGIYSMEGSVVNLPKVLELKQKYKAYVYLDEAHSIGAIGHKGRGVCDYWGCDSMQVDILMGTFTKSFGSAGGYIAGRKELVDHLRVHSHISCYSNTISPPVAQQIISSMNVIMGRDGTDDGENRIKRLAENSCYFRKNLKQMGFIIYGNDDSPVVPLMIYNLSKMSYFCREMLKNNIAIVIVGFPATPITLSRVRLCLSSSHTKFQLDKTLAAIDEIGAICGLKFVKAKYYPRKVIKH